MDKSEPCHGRCYNDYHSSEWLGAEAHLTCAGGERCIPLKEMCQGVDCTETAEECSEKIRCIRGYPDVRNLTTPVGLHFYCGYRSSLNTRTYEHLDRSDEEKVTNNLLEQGLGDISLQTCSKEGADQYGKWLGASGMYCSNHCMDSNDWCRGDGDKQSTCASSADATLLQSTDPRLCGDHQLWRDAACEHTNIIFTTSRFSNHSIKLDNYYPSSANISVEWYGVRCWGTSKHCLTPWYYYHNGEPSSYVVNTLLQTCSDKSDNIHQVNTTCDGSVYLQVHDTYQEFYKYYTKYYKRDFKRYYYGMIRNYSTEFYTHYKEYEKLNKTWLENNPAKQDPHGCWQSCFEPGPGCAACTNPDYFLCAMSGVCIHPELRCDGHPQCQHGEDEDVNTCFDIWVKNKLVSPAASMPCSSRQYPGMQILATACDGIIECFESVDEVNCKNHSWSNYVLAVTIAIMLTVYLGLKYTKIKKKETFQLPLVPDGQDKTVNRILADYSRHRDNPDIIAEVNTYLLYWIQTLPTDEANIVCKRFFELEASIHKNNESKIFHSLHKHFHPLLVETIYNAQFPGLECLEFYRRFNTKIQDHIIKRPQLNKAIATIMTMINISLEYVDIFKDTFLTLSLLIAIGGPGAVLLHPTQFTSMIVLCQATSILFPLLMSGLLLALNNPYLN